MIQAETLELLEWQRLCQHLATFAATKLGAIASRHLLPPTTQAESLQLLAQTKEVYQLETRLINGLTFDGISDIGDSLARAERQGILSGEELLEIATTLAGMRRLRRVIDDQEDVPVLTELVADIRTYPEIEQEIHHCIDERGDVADRASPKLAGIRTQIKSVRDKIYQVLQSIVQRQSNALQELLITQRGDRFVIPVKAPQKDAIPGIVHDVSSSGATLYVEPNAIVGLGNQLRTYHRQEQTEEEVIRRVLTEKIAEIQADLEKLLAVATILDLATAKARYSLWLQANPPRFIERNEGEIITLRELRHPLLVWQEQHEEGTPVVPINVQIQPAIKVVAITGPNTGGKTVTLKTLGLAALMAKVGLFIPAREPVELPWFDRILADIGDEQSLQQSLSTFSGHIRRISRILEALGADLATDELSVFSDGIQNKTADGLSDILIDAETDLTSNADGLLDFPSSFPTPHSLVLLDEVGAGTDPAEGSALAIALLKYLAKHAGLTVATTHYGELKALKYQDERFENASVEFNDSTLQPTYRLLWGIPGRSNALTIARRLGLKGEVVDEAQTLVGGDSEEVNRVISGLEAQRRRQEMKAQEASQLLQQAERLHEEVSQKAQLLQERERELKLSQERAVQDAIAEAKGEIGKVIRKLQQGSQTGQNAQKATAAIKEIAQKHIPVNPPPKPKPGFMPKICDRIRIPKLNQTAEVLTLPNEANDLTVRLGIMKMTVNLADIESLDGQKPDIPVKSKPAPTPTVSSTSTSTSTPVIRTSKNTIDLRGKRVADAEFELEQALAEAIEYGTLWIIHGKGTGKLRQGIHEFLGRHNLVGRFELAEQKEGGGGVTVVYLK
ncbi:MAG TPA: endonuclease MutS2 [Cyanobacteria bacterium UBA11149]|nr:endonuclease MutS2 [Cyanobacteria bacterium UBA11367]HBE58159.1 endonuclease MutS2 [Cyanobacteria bacterium UBA11366]HBR76345.1 endonuclease MutS2 [Cyanobacteria bacterium UBA11159]HBS72168.1 endonuclease MutS2 [Cyanobacteria bacterium UBA11153]HBW87979.1 endonuclease MutS2 [Cyanobacteria bacterium UBA11149]